jgi:hypothetical protein
VHLHTTKSWEEKVTNHRNHVESSHENNPLLVQHTGGTMNMLRHFKSGGQMKYRSVENYAVLIPKDQ